jgi:hypothetical protein
MQFALEVVVLECSFLNHSQRILGVKNIYKILNNFWTTQIEKL